MVKTKKKKKEKNYMKKDPTKHKSHTTETFLSH